MVPESNASRIRGLAPLGVVGGQEQLGTHELGELVLAMKHQTRTERPVDAPPAWDVEVIERGLSTLKDAALNRSPISQGTRRTNSTHEFYRYPARFSPEFAQAAIRAFTSPGQLVIDPFVGGGTTVVEAFRLGRRSVGADINPLATFVTAAKSTFYAPESLKRVERWGRQLPDVLNLHRPANWDPRWKDLGYLRHLNSLNTWRLRNLIAIALDNLQKLNDPEDKMFARCAILRTAQWALDMKEVLPTAEEFRSALTVNLEHMIEAANEYRDAVIETWESVGEGASSPLIVEEGLPGLAGWYKVEHLPPPDLILTSPPYPGVYVLYHRWKLQGRKETAAPYWVAGQLDGNGMAHYTMGHRQQPGLHDYFARMKAAFRDLAQIVSSGTWLIQMVGFKDPETQLPRYLRILERTGFEEVRLSELATAEDGRLWRDVPGRRWWNEAGSLRGTAPHTAQEVVLIHRRSP